jgi:ABC-type Fe3+-siderophore transport system permease subunit
MKTSKLEREQNPYLLTGRGERKLKHLTLQEVDALAFRQLLTSLGLGFAAYVAVVFTTVPHWTNFSRDSWLAIALILFGGALAFLCKALATFRQNRSSKSDLVKTATSVAGREKNRSIRKRTNLNH